MSLRRSILKTRNNLVLMMLSPIMIGTGGDGVIIDYDAALNPSCEVRARALNDSTSLRAWIAISSDADYEVLDTNCVGRLDAMEWSIDARDRIIDVVNSGLDIPGMPFGAPWPLTVA